MIDTLLAPFRYSFMQAGFLAVILAGIVFTGMFALGILLISTVRSFREFTHMLFGNILGATPQDLQLMALIAEGVLIAPAVFHKELEIFSADPFYGRVS